MVAFILGIRETSTQTAPVSTGGEQCSCSRILLPAFTVFLLHCLLFTHPACSWGVWCRHLSKFQYKKKRWRAITFMDLCNLNTGDFFLLRDWLLLQSSNCSTSFNKQPLVLAYNSRIPRFSKAFILGLGRKSETSHCFYKMPSTGQPHHLFAFCI